VTVASAGSLPIPPVANSEQIQSPTVIGQWEKVSLHLREIQVTCIRIGKDDEVWVGTTDGIMVRKGFRVFYPRFVNSDEVTALYVKDILTLADGNALVGTINGAIWFATPESLVKLVDLGDRSEHSFARLEDGTILVANSFGRLKETDVGKIAHRVGRVVVITGEATYVAVWRNRVFIANHSGFVEEYNVKTMSRREVGYLDLPNYKFVRSITMGKDGRLYLATDLGCSVLDIKDSATTLSKGRLILAGSCLSIVEDDQNGLWIGGSAGLFLFSGSNWQRWSNREGLDFGNVGGLALDHGGNLWVGGNGLFRYFNYFREISLLNTSSLPKAIMADGRGGLLVSSTDGSVSSIDKTGRQRSVNLGPAVQATQEGLGYYPGALISRDHTGRIWALNHNGLFFIENGLATKIGDYPIPEFVHEPIASFAVFDSTRIFCGQMWTGYIYQRVGGEWRKIRETPRDPGGSSVPSMDFDSNGRLWVVATTGVQLLVDGKWVSFGPYRRSPDIKKNLFGALAIQSDPFEVFAFGPWGYPVKIGGSPGNWTTQPEELSADSGQPWILHRIIDDPHWGRLAASEQGLFRWSDGRWEPYTQIDPRLSWLLSDVAPGAGTDFWILSKSIWQVRFPVTHPRLVILKEPPSIATSRDLELRLDAEDVQGPTALWQYRVKLNPPIPPYGEGEVSQRSEYSFSNLRDGGSYRYSVQLEDAFGNKSAAVERTFRVAIPWTQNSKKVGAVVAVASIVFVVLLGFAITRRGPTGLILRLLSGRRWQLVSTGIDLTIEIERGGSDDLSFRLQTPTKMTTVVPRVDQALEPKLLDLLRDRSMALAEHSAVSGRQDSAAIRAEIEGLGQQIYKSLPDAVRFVYEQASKSNMQLVLEDSLLDIFWELWLPTSGELASVVNAVARQVGSRDIAYKQPVPARQLIAVLFAPELQQGTNSMLLRQAENEIRCVRARLRSWGANVVVLPPKSSKQAVLEAMKTCHIFHYAGHAEFDPLQPELSYLPIFGDRLTGDEMHNSFAQSPTSMFLAFINGCGSAREERWQSGSAVFGLASAFLRDSTFFVGAQWPVQDSFSWEVADLFYRNVFPTGGAIWWRWLRRKELAGVTFGEALRQVRCSMSSRELTVSTWPAYVYYGDPSARIEWR
jgi:hypothetical protein